MTALAIDQGTTSTRAFVLRAGQLHPVFARSHRQIFPQDGWVEHDPHEILSHLRAALAVCPPDVTCLGLDNQGESCLAWRADTGEPLSNIIVWQDARSQSQCNVLAAAGHDETIRAKTGLPLDPYFSASKLGWLYANLDDAKALHAKGLLRLGTTDAWFRHQLTGMAATDPTTASRTSLMRLKDLSWDCELCALFGVPPDCLPPILPSTGDLGHIRIAGRSLPLSASIVDQQAALYGHGARQTGDSKITFGTGAFALSLTDSPQAPAGLVPTVAWAPHDGPVVYALEGGVHTASSAVNWARELHLFNDMAQICAFAHPSAIGRGLAFVPALAGLAAPHWDRNAKGAWLGLGLDHDAQDLMQALLEGVAFRIDEVVALMQAPPERPVSIDGGMSRNPWFCQFLADILARPLRVAAEPELTALGCAALALRGQGLAEDITPRGHIITPRPVPVAWRARFAAARDSVRAFGQLSPTP